MGLTSAGKNFRKPLVPGIAVSHPRNLPVLRKPNTIRRKIFAVPSEPAHQEDEDLGDVLADEDNEEEILRRAQEQVRQVRARKAAAKKKAEEDAARAVAAKKRAAQEAQEQALRAQQQEEVVGHCGDDSESKGHLSQSSGKAKAQPIGGDPDDGGDGDEDDDDEDDRAPCERCRSKKISCQMQAGKRSSVICKPCHDAKVKCSYSGRPSTVKREGGGNLSSERLAVLKSQVAQLLADNRQLRDGQVKANTYHRHFNRKLDWLITDAARRRRTPPEVPEAGPLGLSKKRRRVMDSDEEEDQGEVEEKVGEEEEDGEGDEPAPRKARSEKGKEREE
ncbi:hypothetical protein EV359DRAFT_88118 [Lentinula novae-zelandiae]|nr:hypothetical protein EV359DRAFT_88118 [Lentinula novae-zelandiae]